MKEQQMEFNFEGLKDEVDMSTLLEKLHDALAYSFIQMNYFASGASQAEYRRVTATDILNEVYFTLAEPYTELRKALNVPELEKMTNKN